MFLFAVSRAGNPVTLFDVAELNPALRTTKAEKPW